MRRPESAPDGTGRVRRNVAVLFADLSGFTALAAALDPEEVYDLVHPLMDRLVGLVDERGGVIQQVLGDGFMAVFGLRVTRCDDAAQAVRAGMDLVGAAAGSPGVLPAHVGVEFGEVLVSSSWQPAAYGVWGHTVNLAKRLCDLAGPGTVHVGPRAFEHTRQVVHFDVPVVRRLKGVPGDVVVRRAEACLGETYALAG